MAGACASRSGWPRQSISWLQVSAGKTPGHQSLTRRRSPVAHECSPQRSLQSIVIRSSTPPESTPRECGQSRASAASVRSAAVSRTSPRGTPVVGRARRGVMDKRDPEQRPPPHPVRRVAIKSARRRRASALELPVGLRSEGPCHQAATAGLVESSLERASVGVSMVPRDSCPRFSSASTPCVLSRDLKIQRHHPVKLGW